VGHTRGAGHDPGPCLAGLTLISHRPPPPVTTARRSASASLAGSSHRIQAASYRTLAGQALQGSLRERTKRFPELTGGASGTSSVSPALRVATHGHRVPACDTAGTAQSVRARPSSLTSRAHRLALSPGPRPQPHDVAPASSPATTVPCCHVAALEAPGSAALVPADRQQLCCRWGEVFADAVVGNVAARQAPPPRRPYSTLGGLR